MKTADKQGWLIICIVGLVFAFIGTLAVYANIIQKQYDPATFCPPDGGFAVVRILIDKTDPWDANGSARLEKIIREIKEQLAINERLVISVLDQSGSEIPTPVFDMCNPGRGDQANALYKNPRRVHEKFETLFNLPLEKMLVDILKPGSAPRSPLLEAIANFPVAGSDDRLVIISDLMQNSERLSFYRGSLRLFESIDIEANGELRGRYGSITVYFIERQVVTRELKDLVVAFWKKHLGQMTRSLIFKKL